VLEASGPIDFDAKLEEWRQSGYDYSGAPRATETGRAQPTASSGGSGTGYTAGATTGTAGRQVTETVSMPETSGTKTAATQTGRTAVGATQPMTGNQDTVKVVEERLRIGKREVAQGAVRVRSYVVERPVEEQVRLHEERVQIERRPVDRPVTPGDANLFQERTIEARATSEEAVVQKEARVVEEIGIKKEAQDRTETVRDTVRETKVEVEDQTARAGTTGRTGVGTTGGTTTGSRTTTGGTTTGGTTTGGTGTNATPGATSSGTNSPRK
jgi:uncharacterized protein (TIGR02271 family)